VLSGSLGVLGCIASPFPVSPSVPSVPSVPYFKPLIIYIANIVPNRLSGYFLVGWGCGGWVYWVKIIKIIKIKFFKIKFKFILRRKGA
jgi:hypothetical protein